MKKWTEIEQFRRVVKYVECKSEFHNTPLPKLLFKGTVKLHGTNTGINRLNGKYTAQGRNRVLIVGADNYGFASWLDTNLQNPTFKHELDAMFDRISPIVEDDVTIFGEWVGKGIQSKVAVSQIPNKTFVVFGAHVNSDYAEISQSINMPSIDTVNNILNAGTFLIGVDFNDPAAALADFERLTLEVERECPFGLLYDISGIGEGIVWICAEHPTNSDLYFKTKGDKHSGKGDKKRNVATVSPEKLEKISDVVDYILTAGRLQQGLEHIDQLDIKCMGQYLKWIGQDAQKEETDTLETNGLEWRDIAKTVNRKARTFFVNRLDEDTFNQS